MGLVSSLCVCELPLIATRRLCSVDENLSDGFPKLNASEIVQLEVSALSLLVVALAINALHCVGLHVVCNSST
jgi:hypothetical protein